MFHSKQPIKMSYPMAAPSNGPPIPKSRGLALFDRQAAQLNSFDSETSARPNLVDEARIVPPALKPLQSFASSATPVSAVLHHHHQAYSPTALPRRLPVQSSESYPHSSNENVQLLRVQPRPELTYIKEMPPKSISPVKSSEKFLETDFPLIENANNDENHSSLSDTLCAAIVAKEFDYLQSQDDDEDDDDDVIHRADDELHPYISDSLDDDDDDENSAEIIGRSSNNPVNEHQRHPRADLQRDSSVNIDDKSPSSPTVTRQEKLNSHPSTMASSVPGNGSEDYDSDFDDSSHEDEDQQSHKGSITEAEDDQQAQIKIRQQQILWGIIQEWSKKEQSYAEQLTMLEQQLSCITLPPNLLDILKELAGIHKTVSLSIEGLWEQDRDLITLIKALTKAVNTLIRGFPLYEGYTQMNLTATRKALEKKMNSKDFSSEDLLSIPTKQFLQILSQVQDLYQTAQTCDTGDKEQIHQLYEFAQKCKSVRNAQDENMNKIILKAEDVVVLVSHKNRDRCRLILYSDAIVCCTWKAKLLASPKYTLNWFIPIADLQITVPQDSDNNTIDTGDELKSNLKMAHKELENAMKSNNLISSRLSKNIRNKESEYNIAQSKLQLILANAARPASSATILFSSNYQRQDWLDIIDKSKQDFLERSSGNLNQTSHQRLTDSLIQKRLDLVKLSTQESITVDIPSTLRSSPSNTQTKSNSTPVTGTLQITIFSIQGPALCNPVRQNRTLPVISSSQLHMQKNYQFFVEVEIDSYNTFFPCAKTSKQVLQQQQQDMVKFKDEVFQIELEHALALRLLVYRIDTSLSGNNNSLERNCCLGKFHCEIHLALNECSRSPNRTLFLESRSGDLKVELTLTHSKRDGTFKRQPSRRSQAVFAKTIENLMKLPSGCIDGIPRIIVKCVRMVEEHGLDETGIYRVCCVTSDLQKLRHQFDRNYHSGERLLEDKNVHVAANLLKLFFRELPEPLFTTRLYHEFINAIRLNDDEYQQVALIKILDQLPVDHRRVLLYLFDHLIRVSEHSNKNMMHLENLAVVFGPTLMRPSKLTNATGYAGSNQRINAIASNNGQTMQTDLDQMSSELQSSMYQCRVVLASLKLRREGKLK